MESLEKSLRKKFEDYGFEIEIPDKDYFNPSVEATQVVLTTKDGKRYSANFITKHYIPLVFDKNRRTGECANGTYFCMKDNMIIVKRIDEKNIKTTLDDLIENREIEAYLTEIV